MTRKILYAGSLIAVLLAVTGLVANKYAIAAGLALIVGAQLVPETTTGASV